MGKTRRTTLEGKQVWCRVWLAVCWAGAGGAPSRIPLPTARGEVVSRQINGNTVWITPLPGVQNRAYAPPNVTGEGRCPIISGLAETESAHKAPLSLVIGVHRNHLALGPRTAYFACVDQSAPPEQVVVVVGDVKQAELVGLAELYWPCPGVIVGSSRPLGAGGARDIGGSMATHALTSFIDGDDLAGPQWSDVVRYFYHATNFAVISHAWGHCGACSNWNFEQHKLVRRCPDRCDPMIADTPKGKKGCPEGWQYCVNGTTRPPASTKPTKHKCLNRDELTRAKVALVDPMVRGNYPQIAFPHITVSEYQRRSSKYKEISGAEDSVYLRDISTEFYLDSFFKGTVHDLYSDWWKNNGKTKLLSETRQRLINGSWGGGPWGLGGQPHTALSTPKYRGKFVLYVWLPLTCKCAGESTNSQGKFFVPRNQRPG